MIIQEKVGGMLKKKAIGPVQFVSSIFIVRRNRQDFEQ